VVRGKVFDEEGMVSVYHEQEGSLLLLLLLLSYYYYCLLLTLIGVLLSIIDPIILTVEFIDG